MSVGGQRAKCFRLETREKRFRGSRIRDQPCVGVGVCVGLDPVAGSLIAKTGSLSVAKATLQVAQKVQRISMLNGQVSSSSSSSEEK